MGNRWRTKLRWHIGPDTIQDVRSFAADGGDGGSDAAPHAVTTPATAPHANVMNMNRNAVKRYQLSALYNLIHDGAIIITGTLSPELASAHRQRAEKGRKAHGSAVPLCREGG